MRLIPALRSALILAAASLTLTACGLKPNTVMGTPGVVGEEDNGLSITDSTIARLPEQLDLTDPDSPDRCRYTDTANGIVFTYPAVFSLELAYTDGYACFCDESGAGRLLYYVDDVSTQPEEEGLFVYDDHSEFITLAEIDGKLCYAILIWQEGSETDFSALTQFTFAQS